MTYDRVFAALRRRRWWILTAVLCCTLVTALGASRMKREYQASATLIPEEHATGSIKELSTPVEVVQDREDLTARQDRLKSVGTILTSATVLADVIEKCNLKTTPAKLQEELDVEEVTSQVLRVSIKDPDPNKATAILNGIVTKFTSFYTDLRSREAKKQIELLEQEQKKSEREMRVASASLEGFKRGSDISSYSDQARELLERVSIIEDERNKTQARMREVGAQVASVSSMLSRVSATREVRRSATNTALLDRMRMDVTELRRQLDKELSAHTDEHPNVQRLKTELTEAERRLASESSKMNESVEVIPNPDRESLATQQRALRAERQGLQARLASLNRDYDRIQAKVSGLSGKDVTLAVLTQTYTLAEQRHAAIVTRLGQLRNVAHLLQSGTPISVVDWTGPHNPPVDLSRGRTLKLSALAFVMSLAVCIALAVGLEMADRRVRSVEDAESLAQLPVVSVVPQLAGGAQSAAVCLTAGNDPSSPMSESFHFLANHVLRQTKGRACTVLMGATGRPQQGATTALTNLAISLARAGKRVVVVEADLRRPFLHHVFSASDHPGLTDVLQSQVTLQNALCATPIDNLLLLPAGNKVADPWSLLWQDELGGVIRDLREVAEYVIVNVPSATVFADAMCIAPHADGAILVMRTTDMPNGGEGKVREWLADAGVPVMGLVLNGVPARDMEEFEFRRSYGVRASESPVTTLAITRPDNTIVAPLRQAA